MSKPANEARPAAAVEAERGPADSGLPALAGMAAEMAELRRTVEHLQSAMSQDRAEREGAGRAPAAPHGTQAADPPVRSSPETAEDAAVAVGLSTGAEEIMPLAEARDVLRRRARRGQGVPVAPSAALSASGRGAVGPPSVFSSLSEVGEDSSLVPPGLAAPAPSEGAGRAGELGVFATADSVTMDLASLPSSERSSPSLRAPSGLGGGRELQQAARVLLRHMQ